VAAYEEALSRCSTKHAPWFIIPANHKWFRNLAITRVVV
jgi:polyphosphate kinase 2 (PPK2 family)